MSISGVMTLLIQGTSEAVNAFERIAYTTACDGFDFDLLKLAGIRGDGADIFLWSSLESEALDRLILRTDDWFGSPPLHIVDQLARRHPTLDFTMRYAVDADTDCFTIARWANGQRQYLSDIPGNHVLALPNLRKIRLYKKTNARSSFATTGLLGTDMALKGLSIGGLTTWLLDCGAGSFAAARVAEGKMLEVIVVDRNQEFRLFADIDQHGGYRTSRIIPAELVPTEIRQAGQDYIETVALIRQEMEVENLWDQPF